MTSSPEFQALYTDDNSGLRKRLKSSDDPLKTENPPPTSALGPEDITKFIRRIKTLPIIYNQGESPTFFRSKHLSLISKSFEIIDHEHFRNSTLKQQAWKEVAEEFGQTGEVLTCLRTLIAETYCNLLLLERWCLRKWVSLRDYFVKRKKRLRTPRGAALRPWIYYNELSFLNIIYGDDTLEYYRHPVDPNPNQEDGYARLL